MSLARLQRGLNRLEANVGSQPVAYLTCRPDRWPDPQLRAVFEQALAAGDEQRAARIAAAAESKELRPRAEERTRHP
jgi:hypothetical protein